FLLCVGHLHDHIERHFGDGSRWNVQIHYSIESTPLGTGGALKNAESQLHTSFLLLNGDSWFDLDVGTFLTFHAARRAADPLYAGSLALARVDDSRAYGSVQIDSRHRIVDYAEKRQSASPWISAGIYVLESDLFQALPVERRVSLERDVLPQILQSGRRLYGHPAEGYFVDIGTPVGYQDFRSFVAGRRNDHPQ
ncbi:MAG: hypothetical protein JSW67_04850, partial [Candidatus Latescibacterota bacterium]